MIEKCRGLLLLLALATPGIADAAAPTRPNVIVVLSDDQGYGDFSCHGNPVLKTPNLDKLHDQSIRLTDFHVAPMCTPTRGQLMTGIDALRNGAMSFAPAVRSSAAAFPPWPSFLPPAGYRTGHFGKWHLGDSYPYLPQHRGFQETVYFLGSASPRLPTIGTTTASTAAFATTADARVSRAIAPTSASTWRWIGSATSRSGRSRSSSICRPTPPTARCGARQVQGALSRPRARPASSA